MDWKEIKKIDAHVHILPEERRQGFIKYQGKDSTWAKAEVSQYINHMHEYNIEKAILQPTNDPYMYFPARETNEYLAELITAHMGGMKYLDAWSGCTWVDISFVLPELVQLYGIEQTNRVLRMFGSKRLIFGTDFPERNYELYCCLLDKMDFTDEEKNRIAYENINKLLEIHN